MAARIFVFVGHPRDSSLTHGLADAFTRGAETEGAEIRRMNLHDMTFDPDLTHGYHQRKTLEPCLEAWRETTLWANHLAWFYPYWWGGMPAKMKGVIDRAFLPGFAMNYREKGPWWDKLLTGRSADVVINADTPAWFDWLMYGKPGRRQAENMVLRFSGIKPVRTLQLAPVKNSSEAVYQRWMQKVYKRGADAGRR